MKTFVVASGYFDCLHVGHLAYLQAARDLGDHLVVIVNNDAQVRLKKGKAFMSEGDRVAIVEALRCVDLACLSIDCDRSVCMSLEAVARGVRLNHPDYRVVFANGGDVGPSDSRESATCERFDIVQAFGVGGSRKLRSSSVLLEEYNA